MDKEKRNKVISFRLTKEEFNNLQKEAKKLNIQTTKLARLKATNKAILLQKAELIEQLLVNLTNLKYLNNNINQIAKYINSYMNIDEIAAKNLIEQQEQLNKLLDEYKNLIKELKKC